MTITVANFTPLQPLDAKCFGVVAALDGNGVCFLLLKDDTHHWGLWQRTQAGLTPLVVPLPGGKQEGDASMVILDGKIYVYYSARIGTDPRPAHECEIIVPHARRLPYMAHVAAIYKELRTSDGEIRARLEALEARQGEGDPSATLEGRLDALEARQRDAGKVLSGAT